jgi:nucleoside-diphosphate-sugar epimerase
VAKVKVTVLGAGGFIGARMVRHLQARGYDVHAPARDVALLRGRNLGHVICAIGLTGNFRERHADTVDAHVTVPALLLAQTRFDSFLYMSSTRVYGGLSSDALAVETATLNVAPSADSLYDLSKLTGEALCLAHPNPAVRVVRLSNVVGHGIGVHTFLGAVVADAVHTGSVTIHEHPHSAKDYVMIEEVLPAMERIALHGNERIYNLASGQNVSAADVAHVLTENGVNAVFSGRTQTPRIFPRIDTSRIRNEFGFEPSGFKAGLASLLTTSARNR